MQKRLSVVPTEYEEQVQLIRYLKIKGFKYFHVPNSTWTKSFNQKRRNTALGVVAGVPDLFIIVNNKLIAIELKRTKGSSTSQEQKDWLEALSNCGIPSAVCKGWYSAVQFIEENK